MLYSFGFLGTVRLLKYLKFHYRVIWFFQTFCWKTSFKVQKVFFDLFFGTFVKSLLRKKSTSTLVAQMIHYVRTLTGSRTDFRTFPYMLFCLLSTGCFIFHCINMTGGSLHFTLVVWAKLHSPGSTKRPIGSWLVFVLISQKHHLLKCLCYALQFFGEPNGKLRNDYVR